MAFSSPYPKTRGINNTPYDLNADLVAQLSGMGNAVAGSVSPTYAATTVLDTVMQYSRYIKIVTTSAVGNSSLTTLTGANPGGLLIIQVNNDAGGARTITFSTGFRSTGTLVGTASQAMVVCFVCDGTTWNEISRTTAYA